VSDAQGRLVNEVHAREIHAYEGFCEDLARQATVTRLPQLRLGSGVVAYGFQSPLWRPKGQYLGRCTVYLGTSAHRPCFDLSVCLQRVCLSPDSQSDCLRFFSPPRPPLL
jgi:hypothetical protein